MWRFPYWCVLSGTPLFSSGYYCYCATLLEENPFIWEPPLQHNTY
jgi:hypothetical protein